MDKRKKEEEEGRDACRNCAWDSAAESRGKPSAVWAPLPGDTARGGETRVQAASQHSIQEKQPEHTHEGPMPNNVLRHKVPMPVSFAATLHEGCLVLEDGKCLFQAFNLRFSSCLA